jgi:hypothetical protein
MNFHDDHTGTCTYLSGASKAHDWMISVLGPLFRTAGHTVRTVRTQFGVTANGGQAATWRFGTTCSETEGHFTGT